MPTNEIVTYQRRMLNMQRLAGSPKLRSYNLAEHSYFVTALFIEFAKREGLSLSVESIEAVLNHDVVETITADLPYMAKNHSSATKEAWAAIEDELVGYHSNLSRFTDEGLKETLPVTEYQLFKMVDILELWIFCKEEVALGNVSEAIFKVLRKCEEIIYGSNPRFPSIEDFVAEYKPFKAV
jgi:5'-deoxynucleotidase YfbR-like HD superfamily hydrolase